LELRDKGRTWDGEFSDSDSENHDLRRRNQGVIASEAAFSRLIPLTQVACGNVVFPLLVFENVFREA
jgi:hypothetical protein